MDWIGYIISAILMLAGFGLLALVIRARKRWVRVVLGIATAWYLAACASLSLLGGMQHETDIHPLAIVLTVVYAIAALISLVFVFIPVRVTNSVK